MTPQNSYSEILIPRAMVFGGGAFYIFGGDQNHDRSDFMIQMP